MSEEHRPLPDIVEAALVQPPRPRSETELVIRARALAGRTIGEVAAELGLPCPLDLRRAKGFVGGLIERVLGADAGPRALPDFSALGVELKTLPVDAQGRPVESTFVCTIPLTEVANLEWEDSPVLRKLRRVLWVPVWEVAARCRAWTEVQAEQRVRALVGAARCTPPWPSSRARTGPVERRTRAVATWP